MKHLQLPLSIEERTSLRAGEMILLSGVIYTARDAAHGRMAKLLEAGEALPVDFVGQVIYYAGPCPAPPDAVSYTHLDVYKRQGHGGKRGD